VRDIGRAVFCLTSPSGPAVEVVARLYLMPVAAAPPHRGWRSRSGGGGPPISPEATDCRGRSRRRRLPSAAGRPPPNLGRRATGARRESGARGEEGSVSNTAGPSFRHCAEAEEKGGAATDETKQGYDGEVGPAGDAARREKGQKTQECSTPPAFAHSTEPDAATTRGAQYAFLQIADAVLDAVAAGVGLRGQKQPDLPCLPSLCSPPPSRALGAMRGGLLRDATTRDCT
jgi:hypothetical protein